MSNQKLKVIMQQKYKVLFKFSSTYIVIVRKNDHMKGLNVSKQKVHNLCFFIFIFIFFG